MKYDYIIVGAGITSCVLAENIANKLDKKVLIVERRNHIGGNCYDYKDVNNNFIQKFGPHAFHTNEKRVWDYLSKFTNWNTYQHRVLAQIDEKNIPIPFNFNSIYSIFPERFAEKLEALLLDKFEYGQKIPILDLKNTDDKDLTFLADYIYKNVFLGYTVKQWGKTPEEIDPSVMARVPVFLSRDDRYFQDTYQGIPEQGYSKMIEKMLNHKNIHILLNADFKDIKENLSYDKLIYTGLIDEYYDYKFGKLPYRSLNFEFKTIKKEFFQEIAQLNFPNAHNYTRITEFKYFYENKSASSVVAYEYAQEYRSGTNQPYYPIANDETKSLYNKYYDLAKQDDNIYFLGRLAEYKYYNMDQAALSALNFFDTL